MPTTPEKCSALEQELLTLLTREQQKRRDPTDQIFSLQRLARKLKTSVNHVRLMVLLLDEYGLISTGKWAQAPKDLFVRIALVTAKEAA